MSESEVRELIAGAFEQLAELRNKASHAMPYDCRKVAENIRRQWFKPGELATTAITIEKYNDMLEQIECLTRENAVLSAERDQAMILLKQHRERVGGL